MSCQKPVEQIRAEFLELMGALLGGLDQRDFRRFVHEAWRSGRYALSLPEAAHALIDEIALSLTERRLEVTSCFREDQVPAYNATLWEGGFAVRVVSDSPDGQPFDEPISRYNIEPHFHFADSIIIVASRPETFTGNYVLHRVEDGEDRIVTVPLELGNVIAFPAGVNHTFKPSGNGLVTINMTHELIVPQTPRFGTDAWTDLDPFEKRQVHPCPADLSGFGRPISRDSQ